MNISKFYEYKNGKLTHIKSFFDISKPSHVYTYYNSRKNNEGTKATVNKIYVLIHKNYNFPENYIYKKFINRPLFESYVNSRLNEFSDELQEITPNWEKSHFKGFQMYINGYIFPSKFKDYNILQYDYFDDIEPKKTVKFRNGIDEFIIENLWTSNDNRTSLILNN